MAAVFRIWQKRLCRLLDAVVNYAAGSAGRLDGARISVMAGFSVVWFCARAPNGNHPPGGTRVVAWGVVWGCCRGVLVAAWSGGGGYWAALTEGGGGKLNGVAGPAFQVIKDSLTLGLNALTLTDVTKNAAYGVEIESLMLEINAPAA
ncbi:hypothetical protein OHD47_03300 [Escherichia coli]|nr:hypothetical protein [Escherichia coli]MCW7359090.1 hypothetical protein [Escherichia coli]